MNRTPRRAQRRNIPAIATVLLAALGGADRGGASSSSDPASREAPTSRRPVATYSIVARDGRSGDMGVAVQSHWFSVGSVVPWAKAGVGAVATQSFVNTDYGVDGLALLEIGSTAPQALAAIVEQDDGRAYRQVGMIDASGRRAVHTGESCIRFADHVSMRINADDVVALANMMARPFVPEAMARGYAAGEGDLAARLITALEHAQRAGGDIRGRQSAAILVVRGEATGDPAADVLLRLHVEDHPNPIAEIRRLYRLSRAYEHMKAGDEAIEGGDMNAAMREYTAAQSLAPENVEMSFWAGVTLASEGRVEEALPLLETAYAADEGDWRELLRRLPESGILPDDEELIATLLGESRTEDAAPAGAER